MKIDRKLNLVVPVERAPGETVYVHSMPLGREVFERYFLVISKAFAAIYNEGLGFVAGPRVAAMLVRRVAEDMKVWEGPEGVQAGLVAEWRRLSNVLAPTAKGWDTIPLDQAIAQAFLDEDDASEVENAIAFFCLASAMHKRMELRAVLDGASKLWGAHVTSLNSTEYPASLPTSTAAENTGAKAIASPIPS
jgi:hypothetical protein